MRAILGLCMALFGFGASCFNCGAVHIIVNGHGNVSPNLDGADLQEGKIYNLTATPDKGYAFNGWKFEDRSPDTYALRFRERAGHIEYEQGPGFWSASGDSIEADFVPNPFLNENGSYAGGLVASSTLRFAKYTVTLTESGAYSGVLVIGAKRFSFSGRFLADGRATTTISYGGKSRIYLNLLLDGQNSPNLMGINLSGYFPFFSGTLIGERSTFNALTNPATQFAGTFTYKFSINNGDGSPTGDSVASLTVNSSGTVTAIGKLADGTSFTSSSPVFEDGNWPLYVITEGGKNVVGGWPKFFHFDDPNARDALAWGRLYQPHAPRYPNGFYVTTQATWGSRYLPPTNANDRVLSATNLAVILEGNEMPGQFVSPVLLTDDNQIINNASNILKVALQLKTGLFTGQITPTGSTKPLPIQGAIFQNQASGSGSFVGKHLAGQLRLVPTLDVFAAPAELVAGVARSFSIYVPETYSAYFWDFGDGTIVSNSPTVTHAWFALGDFQILVHVFDGSSPSGITIPWSVHVIPPYLGVAISQDGVEVEPGEPKDLRAIIDGRATAYFWDFRDGTIVSNTVKVSHAWLSSGDYDVLLKAFDGYSPDAITATSRVHVAIEPIHYVSLSSTNPIPPYVSWETAATNIQDAIDVARRAGVMVSDGVYEVGGILITNAVPYPFYDGVMVPCRVAVTKPITLSSANGPEVTFIKGRWSSYAAPGSPCGSNAVRSVYLTNGAALVGFTVTNGATESGGAGGGIFCASTSATVSNCVLIGNAAGDGAGMFLGTAINCAFLDNVGIGGGAAFYSVLFDCVLSGNYVENGGGGCVGCNLTHCTVSDNSAGWGGGVTASTLDRCLVVGNSAKHGGGGAFNSTLNNSVLTRNSAQSLGASLGGILNNCTVVSNYSATFLGGAPSTFNNSIVIYNEAPQDPNFSTNSTLNFCCTSPMPTNGTGNITSDPAFVNLADGDFHLLPSSPCVDAGHGAYVTNNFDFDGNWRIRGLDVDMGAFELQSAAFIPTQPRWNGMERKH